MSFSSLAVMVPSVATISVFGSLSLKDFASGWTTGLMVLPLRPLSSKPSGNNPGSLGDALSSLREKKEAAPKRRSFLEMSELARLSRPGLRPWLGR